jgi:hypothetical protein
VIRTLKSEALRRILVPLRAEDMLAEVVLFVRWYNAFRPHGRFAGATPAEVRAGVTPATELPRFETRGAFPVTAELRAPRGVGLELRVGCFEERAHLPVVSLKRVA